MARKLNLHHIQTRQEIDKTGGKKPIETPVPTGRFLDTTHNINHQVMKAFDNLPGVYDAKTTAVAHAIVSNKSENPDLTNWKEAMGNLQTTRQQSRKDNPAVLFDLLTNDITRNINSDPVNRRFIDDFDAILRSYHKHIYAGVANQLSYKEKNKVIFTSVMNALGNRIATHKKADLDGLAALKILKECGFTNKDQYIKEIPHKDAIKGYMQVDAGGINGIKVENVQANTLDHSSWKVYKASLDKVMEQVTILLDHHNSTIINGKVSHGTTSSAYIVFKLLEHMNAIPKDKYDDILRFVKFVDIVDSAAIEVIGKDFDNSHKTLIGLQKLILKDYKNIDFIYNQFTQTVDGKGRVIKPAKTGLEILSDNDLHITKVYIENEQRPLKELSDSKKTANGKGVALAEKLLDEGKILTSPLNEESFIVDLDGKLLNAAEVANHLGYGLIKVLPDGKLFIYSPRYMKFDDKTWSTFGDYTRGHILFVDSTKISDWSRFEKTLFNLPENEEMLASIRKALLTRKSAVREKKVQEEKLGMVKSITHGAVHKFVTSKAPIHIEDMKAGQEYDVVVNNVLDNVGVFVTFGKDADKPNIQGKDGYISGLIHKSKLTPKQLSYFKSVVLGEDQIRVKIFDVVKTPQGGYKVQVGPMISGQSNSVSDSSTKTG